MNAQGQVFPNALLSSVGRAWWIVLIYGIVGVLFGLDALLYPMSTGVALAWALGVMALVEGVFTLIALFSPAQGISKGWLVLYGVVSVLFGILAISNPLVTAGSLVYLVALWLIIAGIYRIAFAIRVRKHIRGEWLLVVSGVLAILLGLLFGANPLAGLIISTLWVGAFALVYGIFQVVAAFRLRKLVTA